MPKTTKDLLEFWEDQMKLSHMSSNYFFRKSPSHYHMMLLVMSAYKLEQNLSVEELKTKLFTVLTRLKRRYQIKNLNLIKSMKIFT